MEKERPTELSVSKRRIVERLHEEVSMDDLQVLAESHTELLQAAKSMLSFLTTDERNGNVLDVTAIRAAIAKGE